MRTKLDLLALGAVAVDDLFYIGSYPGPDEKTPVLRRERRCGGMSAIAAITACRLGGKGAYAGVLGRDELSDFAAAQMRREGVDLRHLARRAGVRAIYSVIMIDSRTGTRNIFFDIRGAMGAARDWPPAPVIRSARVLFVNVFSVPGMIRAARIARAAAIPVVADFENDGQPGFSTLLSLTDHLILSQSFAAKLTGLSDPRRAVVKLCGSRAPIGRCHLRRARLLLCDSRKSRPPAPSTRFQGQGGGYHRLRRRFSRRLRRRPGPRPGPLRVHPFRRRRRRLESQPGRWRPARHPDFGAYPSPAASSAVGQASCLPVIAASSRESHRVC